MSQFVNAEDRHQRDGKEERTHGKYLQGEVIGRVDVGCPEKRAGKDRRDEGYPEQDDVGPDAHPVPLALSHDGDRILSARVRDERYELMSVQLLAQAVEVRLHRGQVRTDEDVYGLGIDLDVVDRKVLADHRPEEFYLRSHVRGDHERPYQECSY